MLLHFLCTSWQQNSSQLFGLTGNFSLPIFSWTQFNHWPTPPPNPAKIQTAPVKVTKELHIVHQSILWPRLTRTLNVWCSWSHSPDWNTFNLPSTTQCPTALFVSLLVPLYALSLSAGVPRGSGFWLLLFLTTFSSYRSSAVTWH